MNRSSAPSSPNSLASAAMDESDSEVETSKPRAEDENTYPVEGMYASEAEKREIMAMREIEREQFLADRNQEITRQRQTRMLRQLVNHADNEERKGKKKRTATSADLDDDSHRPSRQRTGKTGMPAMETLKRARAERQKRREDHERRRDNYSPGRGDSSAGEESDGNYGRRRSRTPEKEAAKEQPPPELRDYDRVRLGRNEFSQVCLTPGFETAIAGCFIRVAVGPHPETGIEQYRMAIIKGKKELLRMILISFKLLMRATYRLFNRPTLCN